MQVVDYEQATSGQAMGNDACCWHGYGAHRGVCNLLHEGANGSQVQVSMVFRC